MKKLVIGILAHVDSGKTTLSEAMLFTSGAIAKLGRVDHHDSFFDTFSLERKRGITIFSKQAVMPFGDTEFTLLDTPGHVDFSAETERTLQVLDYAILVISGTDGVQSHTQTLWKLLQKYRVPTFIFVNKTDLPGVSRKDIINNIRTRLCESCVDFSNEGTADFYESIAVCDEALLNQYYDTEKIKNEDIKTAIKKRLIFPCFFGSALKLEGVEQFLGSLDSFTVMPDYPIDFGAKVFKISEDNQGNRLTHMKITGGALRVKEALAGKGNLEKEKVNQIRIYSGERFSTAEEAVAGTVCSVTGITFARPGDGLGIEKDSALPVLEPVLTYRMELPPNADVHTVLSKMRILENEDPQLRVFWNERLGEIQVQLMGEIQLEILQSLISQRFGIDVGFGRGSIIYKETISNTVEGVGHFEPLRHYAEVHLILKPAERNSGLVFKTECKEDLLDKNWQRLILTHLYEKTHLGVLTGAPITDMEIILASGKAHPKHTEGGDFRQATYRAVRQGLRCAESVLLEPVYEFTLEVPSENIGRAMSDIQRMHGSFNQPEQIGEASVITGTCPVATMCDYTSELLQYTRGTGRLSCTLKGYEPCHNANEVIESIAYNCDADTENTCDSVFCSHGAGYNVKWNEVKSHMHLPSALSSEREKASLGNRESYFSGISQQKNIFALDKELMQIFEQTYGTVKKRSVSESRSRYIPPKSSGEKYKRSGVTQYEKPDYLLIDGYNVIFSWESLKAIANDNIESARQALINILCNYQGYKKCELILVFDAYKVKGNPGEVERLNNINIVYTKEAETADMYIEKVTHKLAKNHLVRVVTSDGLEQLIILGNGAFRVSSREFEQEVLAVEEEIRRIIAENV